MLQLKRYRQPVQRFVGTYCWLVRFHVLDRPRLLITILVVSVFGALAQAGSIGLIGAAAGHLSGQGKASLSALSPALAQGNLALWAFGAALLLTHAGAAFSTFLSAKLTRRLAREKHVYFLVDILQRCANWRGALTRGADRKSLETNEIRLLSMRDPNHIGQALEALVRMVEPVLRCSVAAVLLVALQPMLTLAVVPFLLLLLPVLYRLSAGIQSDARRFYEDAATKLAANVGDVLGKIEGRHVGDLDRAASVEASLLTNSDVDAYFDGLDRIRLTQFRSQFILSLFSSILLSAGLLISGYLASIGSLSWAMVIGYVMALRFFVNNMKGVITGVTQLNRFYPGLRRYLTFLEEIDEPQPEPTPVPPHITIQAVGSLAESQRSVTLTTDEPVWIACPHKLQRFQLPEIVTSLIAGSDAAAEMWSYHICFDSDVGLMPALTAEELATGGETTDARLADCAQTLAELQIEQPAEFSGVPLEDGLLRRMDREYLLALRLMAVSHDRSRIVFLDAQMLSSIAEPRAAELLSILKGRYVFLIANHARQIPSFIQTVIALDGDSVAGVGDPAWFDSVRDSLKDVDAGDEHNSDGDEMLLVA